MASQPVSASSSCFTSSNIQNTQILLLQQLNDSKILPHQETLTRIKLADLLLGCSDEIEGPLIHLERAVRNFFN